MKWVPSLLALLALAGLVQPAAADGPGRRPSPVVTTQATNWSGSFIGVQAGYAWGNDPVEFTSATGAYAADLGTNIPASLAGDPKGFVGGAQWGTNYRSGRLVYGFYSDFSYSDIEASGTVTQGTRTSSAEQHLKWFSTSRVRAGYLLQDNFLLYASGGLASGSTEVSVANPVTGGPCAAAGACPAGSESRTRYGWALGAGAEYVSGPWSVTLDYIHYDLGDVSVRYSDGIAPGTLTASADFSGDMVRGGLNYRFNFTFFDVLLNAVK